MVSWFRGNSYNRYKVQSSNLDFFLLQIAESIEHSSYLQWFFFHRFGCVKPFASLVGPFGLLKWLTQKQISGSISWPWHVQNKHFIQVSEWPTWREFIVFIHSHAWQHPLPEFSTDLSFSLVVFPIGTLRGKLHTWQDYPQCVPSLLTSYSIICTPYSTWQSSSTDF